MSCLRWMFWNSISLEKQNHGHFKIFAKNTDNRKNIIPLKPVNYNVAHIIIINS